MSKIIGIDLGTTFSAVALMEGGQSKIIPNSEGNRTTPSVVTIKDGDVVVGELARRQAIVNPKNTIRSIKRVMGTKEKIEIDGRKYTPEQISAMILQKLKRDAEAYLGVKVDRAVITVPAYFNDAQRKATKDAGEIAGFKVERVFNEPTSAALAYGLDKQEKDHKIMVFDLGGGTFDVSILELGGGVFEVLATNGDNHLGGDDFDEKLIDYMAEEFKKEYGVDLREDITALQRLKDSAEKAKIELSTSVKTNVNLPFITADKTGPKHLNIDITRAKFDELTSDLVERTVKPVKQALKDAKLTEKDLDKVLLVGGSIRIPAVQKIVKELTRKEPDKSIHPDEAVALGAAIQAAVLGGEVKDILLLDVTPLSLGIETLGGIFTKIVDRNTTVPVNRKQVFSTATDSQPAVTVNVLQGEREMATDNNSLGRFELVGIPPAPRGVPQIEVSFDIDADGILSVNAKDLGTGKEQKITISGSKNLSKEEVEKMKKEAEKNAEGDKKKKESIEVKNQADSLIYSTEKVLKEYGDKVEKSVKESIDKKVEELKEAVKKDDTTEIKRKIDELNKTVQEIGAKIYSKVQEQQQQKANEDPEENKKDNKKKEKVFDADYEEEK